MTLKCAMVFSREKFEFVVDHPFIMLINVRLDDNQTTLFNGKIMDPTST